MIQTSGDMTIELEELDSNVLPFAPLDKSKLH